MQITRAFVLGAGLGTRLKRLTEVRPKPLIPVAGRPLIASAFDHLIDSGIRQIVINTHHLAAAYGDAFPGGTYREVPLTFRHEPVLLETGGGIKNVEDLLGAEPFIVYNGDILATLPLEPALAWHLASGNEVTLVLRSQGGPLQIALDAGGDGTGRVLDIGNRLGRAIGTRLFTGIYIVNPTFFRRLTLEKASVIPAFLKMIEEGAGLGGIVLDEGHWWDLGTREQYLEVHRHLRKAASGTVWIDPSAHIDPSATITGASYVGPNAEIGPDAQIKDSILWNGTKIAKKTVLKNCVVTDLQCVAGDHVDRDF